MYRLLWRNKFLTVDATTIQDFIDVFEHRLAELKSMKAHGINLNPDSGISDDYAEFETDDDAVAKLFDFEEHDEYDEGEIELD